LSAAVRDYLLPRYAARGIFGKPADGALAAPPHGARSYPAADAFACKSDIDHAACRRAEPRAQIRAGRARPEDSRRIDDGREPRRDRRNGTDFTETRRDPAARELQRRWAPPARDYARLQIARLEKTSANLLAKAEAGDLPSLDRLLRIMDRLDRYHGFSRLTPPIADEYAGMHERLMAKINAAAARLQPPPEGLP